MAINKTPTAIAPLITLGAKALAGTITHGVNVGLEHNTAAHVSIDFYDLMGNPATPEVPGKQDLLNAQRAAVKTATADAHEAVAAGREYCRLGVALLKPALGTRYNSDWLNAGFLTPSLGIPRDPVPMLLQFRQYFVANPAHENAATDITAAVAQSLQAAILATGLAKATARDLRREAQTARDASLKQLRTRLSGLRAELEQLLAPDDGTWEEFGFRVPADGRKPQPVPDLVLTPGGSGLVLAQWGLASLALDYRVLWRVVGSGAEWTEVGLFTERQCALPGLPSGQTVAVGVTARNNSGETTATEAQILVP